jgi:hypothetical protein
VGAFGVCLIKGLLVLAPPGEADRTALLVEDSGALGGGAVLDTLAGAATDATLAVAEASGGEVAFVPARPAPRR